MRVGEGLRVAELVKVLENVTDIQYRGSVTENEAKSEKGNSIMITIGITITIQSHCILHV
jgi:ribosome-binding protein aMBF1 (putative translation factor)